MGRMKDMQRSLRKSLLIGDLLTWRHHDAIESFHMQKGEVGLRSPDGWESDELCRWCEHDGTPRVEEVYILRFCLSTGRIVARMFSQYSKVLLLQTWLDSLCQETWYENLVPRKIRIHAYWKDDPVTKGLKGEWEELKEMVARYKTVLSWYIERCCDLSSDCWFVKKDWGKIGKCAIICYGQAAFVDTSALRYNEMPYITPAGRLTTRYCPNLCYSGDVDTSFRPVSQTFIDYLLTKASAILYDKENDLENTVLHDHSQAEIIANGFPFGSIVRSQCKLLCGFDAVGRKRKDLTPRQADLRALRSGKMQPQSWSVHRSTAG